MNGAHRLPSACANSYRNVRFPPTADIGLTLNLDMIPQALNFFALVR